MAKRELADLRYTCEEAGPIMEDSLLVGVGRNVG
jgi:hypothetical protein